MFTVRVWDLPTRLFHWSLALCVLALVLTGQVGGNWMVWHFRLGYAVLSLLLFRLLWGFCGGHWSRWRQLALSPRQVWAYARGRSALAVWAGHNPLGSWSVLLLLLCLLLQVSTGLVSDDEIANAGPLTAFVSGATVSAATAWHKSLGKLMVIALVLGHVSAIVWYHWRKRQALVRAMLSGDKTLPEAHPSSRDTWALRVFALLLVLLCAAAVRWLVALGTA